MLRNETNRKENHPAIMPEKISNPKMASSSKCSCCPYGFHIDRDFVRFCDTLYNTAQLDKLRQQRRERRKEKKSVESYLGIGNLTPLITKRNTEVTHPVLNKTATLPNDFYLHNDGLKDAVSDFEDTWNRSLKKSSSSNDILKKQNGYFPIHKKPSFSSSVQPFIDDRKDVLLNSVSSKSCSSSTSSVSSQSTTVSNFNGLVATDASISEHISHNINTTVNLYKPVVNVGTSAQKSVLTNIRHQMASSLQRLKELEEQVKCIPILEVKLSALREEKKSLLNQLKFSHKTSHSEKKQETQRNLENQLKRLENQGIMSPTSSRKCLSSIPTENRLSSPGMASCLNAAISKKCDIEKELFPQSGNVRAHQNYLSEASKSLKSVGTSCSVLTRDIGIGYVPNKLKSVAVGCDTVSDCKKCTSKKNQNYEKFVNLSSESLESDVDSLGGSYEQIQPIHSSSLKSPRNLKNIIKTCTDSSTSMNITYINKSVNTELMSSSMKRTSPITHSKFVQTSELKVFKNSSSQTESESKSVKTYKCDKAVGYFDVNDTKCFQCKKIKKSIAVGDFDVNISSCDKCRALSTVNPVSSPILTKSVGVGDFDVDIKCDECQSVKSKSLFKTTQMQSVAINTTSDLVNSSNILNSDIHICDKCSATIHSVARGLAANTNTLNSASNNDSKIPISNLRASPTGKTNNTKLPKLKIPDYRNQKNLEASDNSRTSSESSKDMENDESNMSLQLDNQTSKMVCQINNKTKEIQEETTTTEILPTMMNLPALPRKKCEISKEIKAACKVSSDCLQKSDKGSEKKAISSLSIIQTEWFRIANQKNADPLLIEDYLDLFEDFSRLLLQRVVNLSDNNGNTALHYAVSYGNFDVVSILIDSKVCDVNKKNKAGYTSIMLVALAEMKNDTHQYVVHRLFSIGDINIKATQNGQTALMLAVSHGKKEIAKILIDAGAEVNLQDKDGSTALMCAAEHGHIDIVKFLLSNPECDPTIVDNDDCNALTIAMEAGHKDIGLLIYTSMNFSRGSSPYSTLKSRKRSTPRSTPPPRTPTLRTPPLPSPSARSTNSIPSSFHFSS